MINRAYVAFGVVAVLVSLGLPGLGFAEVVIELPGVEGAYSRGVLEGEIAVPGVAGAPSAVLRVSGNITPGTVQYCTSSGIYPYGSEVHLFLYLGSVEGVLWSIADLSIDPVEGPFVAEVPVNNFDEVTAPLFGLGVSVIFGFEFYVGYHPDELLSGCTSSVPATVTIETAYISSAEAVSAEETSWGGVRSLFK